jgi:hypothetical protein
MVGRTIWLDAGRHDDSVGGGNRERRNMVNLLVNQPMSDVERRRAIFDGGILLFSRRDATTALVDHARGLIAGAFGAHGPEEAQFSIEVDEFIDRVGPLKTLFTNDDRTKVLVRDVLGAFGCDLDTTYFDVPRLRVVPHGGYLSSGVSYAYKAHRDTWYASPPAQVNWWMPVFPVLPSRAMSFFPAYFAEAVPNSSARFDYGEWCRVGRQLAASQVGEDTRAHPLPQSEIDTTSELRVAGDAGELLVFSAGQLHATAPNESGATRFSIDFRTVSLDDLEAGNAAVNVDSEATGTTLGDFIRAADFAPHLLAPAIKVG